MDMNKILNFLVGLLVGALFGGVVALLLAPSSGQEIRRQIGERVQYVQDEVKRASSEKRADLERQLADLRAPRRPSA
jgi:gas vesicle protein